MVICGVPNKEHQKELVHKNKWVGNARSKIYQIISYFKAYIYQTYGKLSSLYKQTQGHEGICLTDDFSVLSNIL